MEILPRSITPRLVESLGDSRIVYLDGPRQCGKTTVVRQLASELGGTYVTLDDPTQLAAARADPVGFARVGAAPKIIDEVQRAGEPLLLALKQEVDSHPTPGRFLLTGSTRFLTTPRLSESLAGRVELLRLLPLTQGELARGREDFISALESGPAGLLDRGSSGLSRLEALERVCTGGFPEPALRATARSRRRWFQGYVTTVTQRDILELSRIRRAHELPRMMRLLAARTAAVLNRQDMARDLGISHSTFTDYLGLVEAVLLVQRLPAWSTNLTTRVARHPKLHLVDSGLAAHLLGATPEALMDPAHRALGSLVETFVHGELRRQLTWSEAEATLFHYREHTGAEVDLVLEYASGAVAGVEVKASESVGARDFRWLRRLQDKLGERFVAGVVLYLGEAPLAFGAGLAALPLSSLWADANE